MVQWWRSSWPVWLSCFGLLWIYVSSFVFMCTWQFSRCCIRSKAKPSKSKVVQKWLASRYVVKAKPGKDEARPSLARLYRHGWPAGMKQGQAWQWWSKAKPCNDEARPSLATLKKKPSQAVVYSAGIQRLKRKNCVTQLWKLDCILEPRFRMLNQECIMEILEALILKKMFG